MSIVRSIRRMSKNFQRRQFRSRYESPHRRSLALELLEDRRLLFVPYGGGAVWESPDLTFSYSNLVNGSWAAGLNNSQLVQAAEEAMGVWASVSPLTFTQTGDSGPLPTTTDSLYSAAGTPQIRWGHHLLDGPPNPMMPTAPNTLAHGFRPGTDGRNGDIHFDNADTFTINNFLQTATHEIGHTLGLDHANGDVADYDMDGDTECPGAFAAIMHACIGGGGTWSYNGLGTAFLLQDDINGIQSLYDAGLGYVLNSTGQLSVFGTNAVDIISVDYDFPTNMLTVRNGINSFTRTLSGIAQVAINGQGGDDLVFVGTLPSSIITVVNGGAGNDGLVIRGGEGNDTLRILNGTTATNNNSGVLFNSVTSVTLAGNGGADVLEVAQLPANLPVTIDGGNQNDQIFLANGGSTGAINSPITINGDSGDDTIYLAANAPGGVSLIDAPVVINGGAGFDTLNVGSGGLHAVSGLVTFNAGGGKIKLDDSANAFFVDYLITNNSITRDTPFFFGGVNYSGVGSVELSATQGPNIVTVNSATINSAIINGNGGDDNFIIGNGNNLAGGIGLFAGSGGPGVDTLTLNDANSTHDLPWAVLGNFSFDPQTVYLGLQAYDTEGYESVTVLGGNGNNNFQFNGTMAHNVTVQAGGGDDTVELNDISNFRDFETQNGDPAFNYAVNIDGGAGFNALIVDDALATERSYIVSPNQITAFESAPLGMRFAYDSFQSVTLQAGSLFNDFLIFGTSPDIPAGQQMSIFGGPEPELFTIRPRDEQGNLTINGNLGISGGGGFDSLVVDDTASALPINYSFFNQFGPGTTNIGGLGAAGFGAGSNIESITVSAGSGNDTFSINAFQSGSSLAINGGAGADTVNFGTTTLGVVTNMASFHFNGQEGIDTFNINNSTNPFAWTYTRNLGGIGALSSAGANYFMTDSNVELMRINAGAQVDIFNVNGVAEGTQLALNAGAGLDGLDLGQSTSNVDSIRGVIVYDGQADGGNMLVRDTLDTTGDIVHQDATSLGAYANDTLFGVGGALYFSNLVNFGAFPGITLHLGSGDDQVFAQPLASARVTVNGANPTTAPGDRLRLLLTGVTNPVFTSNGVGAGTYMFSGAQALNYTGFETVAAAYPGDFNLDGFVGPEDLAAWQAGFGANVVPGNGADGNGDGKVNGADFLQWQRGLGMGVAPFAAALSNGSDILKVSDLAARTDLFDNVETSITAPSMPMFSRPSRSMNRDLASAAAISSRLDLLAKESMHSSTRTLQRSALLTADGYQPTARNYTLTRIEASDRPHISRRTEVSLIARDTAFTDLDSEGEYIFQLRNW